MMPTTDAVSLGRAIRERRQALGLSQLALARRTDLKSQAAVWNVENGTRRLTFVDAVKVCRALGLSLYDLAPLVPEVPACPDCNDAPPTGFTCNRCRSVSLADPTTTPTTSRPIPAGA